MAKSHFLLNIKTKDSLKQISEKLASKSVKFGFLKSKGQRYPDGESVIKVAMQNEYGAIVKVSDDWRAKAKRKGITLPETWNIPSRPFFQYTWDKQFNRYKQAIGNYYKSLANGKDVGADRFLGLLGKEAVEDVQQTITNAGTIFSDKPNDWKTVRIKDSASPLLDSGLMRQSVTFQVVDNA